MIYDAAVITKQRFSKNNHRVFAMFLRYNFHELFTLLSESKHVHCLYPLGKYFSENINTYNLISNDGSYYISYYN